MIIVTGILILILFNALNGYSLYTSFHKVENLSSVSLDISQLVFGIMGMLMIVIGNIMPKLRMNSMIGLRTHWSMKDEITWKKSQHIGGISFIIGGIIIIGICVTMKGILCLLAVLGVLAILIVIDIFLTYRIANDCKSEGAQRQIRLADCQRKAPKKNIRQNRFAVSRQCRKIHHDKKDRQL